MKNKAISNKEIKVYFVEVNIFKFLAFILINKIFPTKMQ